jgi:hypothetical protein
MGRVFEVWLRLLLQKCFLCGPQSDFWLSYHCTPDYAQSLQPNVYRFQLLDVQVSRAHRVNELTVVSLEDGGRYRPALLVSYTWV